MAKLVTRMKKTSDKSPVVGNLRHFLTNTAKKGIAGTISLGKLKRLSRHKKGDLFLARRAKNAQKF